MCGWVTPPTPSIPFGSNMPCQWTVVCSGSLLVTKMRTLSPSTASIVGPGAWPLQPHKFTFMPGENSRTTGSATRILDPLLPDRGEVGPAIDTKRHTGRQYNVSHLSTH